MAMINCPHCGEQVSDKAMKCVHCGAVFIEEAKKVCAECGAELSEKETICHKCGCPVETVKADEGNRVQQVEVTGVKTSRNFKKIILATIIAVIVIIAGCLINKNIQEKKAAEQAVQVAQEYYNNMQIVTTMMINGAAMSEESGNLIKRVWANAIYEERDSDTDKYTRPDGFFVSDFNDALTNLFSDGDFLQDMLSIEENQDQVNSIMKELKDPPEEYVDAYNDLKEFYNAYLSITNLATNPTGSLTTYSSSFNEADSETLKCYETMILNFE